MQKKKLFKILLLLFYSGSAYGKVKAISSLYFDEGKVKSIYLAPTVPTLLEFPCNIVSSLKDVAGNIEGAPDKDNPRRLIIWLKNAQTSTITVLCEKKVFVFKIHPSTYHQAYIKVLGSYGGPDFVDVNKSTLFSSEKRVEATATKKPVIKKVLISSEGRAQ